jgi:hypothetical protein
MIQTVTVAVARFSHRVTRAYQVVVCSMPNIICTIALLLGVFCLSTISTISAPVDALRVGVAGHAFDHLGDIGDQADAAAASGANILYGSGLGVFGYQGLPAETELEKARQDSLTYTRMAKAHGIRLSVGYVCATSMVGLETFDKNWTPKFRAQFQTPPAEWRQRGHNGNPLPSWYGGKYEAACMNNPDWRVYEKNLVRLQLESGYDGIFFDNPTVHSEGCYCRFCMEKFGAFLAANKKSKSRANTGSLETLRQYAVSHPREFMEFRCGIASDFLREMRAHARSIKRGALITCNNSLNSPDALFSQCRHFAYDIDELSKTEDWITVEDMVSQPRLLANGQTFEYGPTYKQLRAISHEKPVVAVTLAEADYHTPPNLVRLAMAEAAANGASYLSWPTWPENVRQKMSSTIRPEADFLRSNEKILNDTKPRCDVVLLLSFHRWLDTDTCKASECAATLARANIQFTVASEAGLKKALKNHSQRLPVLVIEQLSKLDEEERGIVRAFQKHGGRVVEADEPGWFSKLAVGRPAITLEAPPTIRTIVADQRNRAIVHLYNLGIERLSSFEDKVHLARDIRVSLRVPFTRVHSVRALTADAEASGASLDFAVNQEGEEAVVKFTVPRVEIGTILVIERLK